MEDVEPFIEWLRRRGTPEPHLDAHRHFVAELAKHPSLTAALRAYEEAGAPSTRIANLRQTAARIAEFREAQRNPELEAPPIEIPPVVVAPREPRQTASPRFQGMTSPRKGCTCRQGHDVFLDADFGSLATMLGGGIGIGMIILIRFIGLLGAFAIAFGLAGLGGLVTILSICFRCEDCRNVVRDLDDEERAVLRKGRGLVTLVTAGLFAGALMCGYLWWSVVTAAQF